MSYICLKKKLAEAKLFFKQEPEKTIFSIGGRGHYENPITDVLAFFLNPQEEHGFGTLFIECFFAGLNLTSSPQSLDIIDTPKREISTANHKRIDLLLEGDEWVLVVENKIYHVQTNPFTEYEEYIREHYKDKTAIFVILSPQGFSISSKWNPLSYQQLVKQIKSNIGDVLIESSYSKWVVFLRDFILNLEQFAVRRYMSTEAINFVEDNFQDIYKILKLRESYINHIQQAGLNKLKKLFPKQKITTTVHNWEKGPAIRFYSESWDGKSNIVIQLGHSKKNDGIGLYLYAYNINELDIHATDEKLLKDYYKKPWTELKTVRCYESGNRYKHINEVFSEFEEAAQNFNDFNLNKKL